MKSKLFTALCLGIAIVACNKENSTVTPASPKSSPSHHYASRFTDSTDTLNSAFISMDVANAMIGSYLASINASTTNDSDITALIVNADSLRAYLSNTSIKNVKLMFAHTQAYIKAGNTGVNAGYQSGALTIIIAGYDAEGNYVYNGGNVLDHAAPCPYSCPSGNAGSYYLQ